MLEGQRRGHAIAFCELQNISLSNANSLVSTRTITLSSDIREHKKLASHHVNIGDVERHVVSDYDVVFIRKDPPFDTRFLALTFLLTPLENKVRFVNSPSGLRNISEKLSAFLFADYTPETLVSFDADHLLSFARRFDKVVLKPAFLASGKGILLSSAGDENFVKYVDLIMKRVPEGPVIVQAFLPEVVDGDTRVMVLDGRPIAALGRKPAAGDFRANIAAGGTEFAAEISKRQRHISGQVGDFLKTNGIVFAGLDFIGDKLIEINVTSPTLIQELRRVSGFDMSIRIFDYLEDKD